MDSAGLGSLVLPWEGTGTGARTNLQASSNAESLKVWLRNGPHDSLRGLVSSKDSWDLTFKDGELAAQRLSHRNRHF